MSTEKRRKQHSLTSQEKKQMWDAFQHETAPHSELECVYTNEIKARELCDLCQTSLVFSEDGFLTCTNSTCGIIYKDMLDCSPEWRFYGADDNKQHSDPTRCGLPMNPLLEESSYGCKVICVGKSSYEMRKIRRYAEWQSMPYREKAQYEEFQRITSYANNAGISKKIIDDAIKYHKKIREYEQTFRGVNKDGLIAASIYISFRINNYPRTAKELAVIFHLNPTDATYGCKNAQVILNILENDMVSDDKTVFCKTKPEDFIERYCSKLNINNELTKLCQFIAIKIEKLNMMPENTPHSIAAGIVYFVSQLCNLNVSKRDVKNVSEMSEVTINKCSKKLEQFTTTLIPKVILDKYKPKT